MHLRRCAHVFCSRCIRASLSLTKSCPECRDVVNNGVGDLKNLRTLEAVCELKKAYSKVFEVVEAKFRIQGIELMKMDRDKIGLTKERNRIYESENTMVDNSKEVIRMDKSNDFAKILPSINKNINEHVSARPKRQAVKSSIIEISSDEEIPYNKQDHQCSVDLKSSIIDIEGQEIPVSKLKKQKMNGIIGNQQTDSNFNDIQNVGDEISECPACRLRVRLNLINAHLDSGCTLFGLKGVAYLSNDDLTIKRKSQTAVVKIQTIEIGGRVHIDDIYYESILKPRKCLFQFSSLNKRGDEHIASLAFDTLKDGKIRENLQVRSLFKFRLWAYLQTGLVKLGFVNLNGGISYLTRILTQCPGIDALLINYDVS